MLEGYLLVENPLNHSRYGDFDAVAAVSDADSYVRNSGDIISGDLAVTGTTEFGGDTSISGDANVGGSASVVGNIDAGGHLFANRYLFQSWENTVSTLTGTSFRPKVPLQLESWLLVDILLRSRPRQLMCEHQDR